MKVFALKSGKEVVIRIGNIADAEACIDYLQRISGESDNLTFGTQEVTITPEEQKEFIQKLTDTQNQLFLIAEVDGMIVGNLTFRGGSRLRTQHAKNNPKNQFASTFRQCVGHPSV